VHHTKATPLASRRARGVVLPACGGVLVPADGYPAVMRTRLLRSWVIAVFILLGILVALALIVRDLGDGDDVPEQNGTMPVSTR
jgi:hypothetical protein